MDLRLMLTMPLSGLQYQKSRCVNGPFQLQCWDVFSCRRANFINEFQPPLLGDEPAVFCHNSNSD